ncbi:NAD-dependent epimerase/dehydratase family protein [Geminocystis sp.]|uniref:NAD-dependent epimerase/dehydratase family protein n=1 Tax=Geminocystis sp. TaxID=2664100 RepID=UPI003593F3B4
MHITITGGAGFIGSHLTEFLLKKGHQITIIDNLTSGKLSNLPSSIPIINKSISQCQPEDFPKSIDGIVHLAATPSVNNSWLKPIVTHHNNVSEILHLIQLCNKLKISRLVFASSAAVYGNPINLPINESHPTDPVSPYGLHKLFGEKYINLFVSQHKFSAINLRFFNVFGSKQDPNSPYSGVISIFINAMKNNQPITIFGDGQQTRDFIYVKDIVNSIYLALTKNLDNGQTITCNIGTGKAISLLDFLSELKIFFPQWKESINFQPRRLGDIIYSQADISKAISELNYQPNYELKPALTEFLNNSTNIIEKKLKIV